MEPVSVDARKIVPEHVTDFILQNDELCVGVIRVEVIPPAEYLHKGAFYIIAAMPLEEHWTEGINYAPLAVYFRDETDFCSLQGYNEAAPPEIAPALFGIAYALTMQGVEVYTHQPYNLEAGDSPPDVSFTLGFSANEWSVGETKLSLPKTELFNPGTPPDSVLLLREKTHPKLGVIPKAYLSKWFMDKLKLDDEIDKFKSTNPCGEIESGPIRQTSETF